MGDLVPFPAPNRDVFIDGRGEGRVLRASWHPSEGMVVLSLWEWDHCRATFRLAPTDVPDLIALLAGGLPDHAGLPRAAAPPGEHAGFPPAFPPGRPDQFVGQGTGGFPGQLVAQPAGAFPDPFTGPPGDRFPGPFPGPFPDGFADQGPDQLPARPPERPPGEAPFFTAGGFQTELPPGYQAPPGPWPEERTGGRQDPLDPTAQFPPPQPVGHPANHPDFPPQYPGNHPDFPPQFPTERQDFGPGHDQQPPYPAAPEPPSRELAARQYPTADGHSDDDQYPAEYLGPRTGFELPAVGQQAGPAGGPAHEPYEPWPSQPDHPAVAAHGYPAPPMRGYPAEGGFPAEGPPYHPDAQPFPADTRAYPAEAQPFAANAQPFPAEAQAFPADAHDFPAEPQPFPAEARAFPADAHDFPAEPEPAPSAEPPWGGGGGGSWGAPGASAWDERAVPAPRDRGPGHGPERGDAVANELETTQFHPGPDFDSAPDYPPADFGDLRHQPALDYPAPFAAGEQDGRPRRDPFVADEYPSRH